MKKITTQFFAALLLLICTGEFTNAQIQNSCNIGTGNGSGNYWPLAVNNSWSYSPGDEVNTVTSLNDGGVYTLNEGGTINVSLTPLSTGELDAQCQVGSGLLPNFFVYIISSSQPFVYIPASPAVGYTWSKNGIATCTSPGYAVCNVTAEVLSLNATVQTSSCTYTNCLEIQYAYQVYDMYNVLLETETYTQYFKQGIGIVSSIYTSNSQTTTTYNLMGLQLSGCNTTGVDNIEPAKAELNVYPNPANQYAEIKLSATGNYRVSLLNVIGQEIAKAETTQTTSFETQQLPSGIYFVKVIDKANNAELATRRFVVAH